MNVDRSLPLYQSTTATIRYQDLIGNRYINLERGTGEGADRTLPAGGDPAVPHNARAGSRRVDRRFQAAVRCTRSREGEYDRLVADHRLQGRAARSTTS